MLKNLKNAYVSLLMAVCCLSALVGCAAAPATESETVAVVSQTPAPVVSVADSSDVVDELPEEPVEESNVHSDTAESTSNVASETDWVASVDWDRVMVDPAYDDEVFAVYQLSAVANLQSLPETDSRYCVVDMRKNHETYDVDWDYGSRYEAFIGMADWDKVFDIDYYESMFPMLAIQYHHDEDQLLRHFQTVGIHEGRQGSADFNVGAYMDWCKENLPYTTDAFQGDYALYYLFYAAANDDQPESFPADGRPAQYEVIMTYSQKEEFDAVNNYRADAGLDPYVYDPEMSAFANFRAWTNQDQEFVGHTWLYDDKYDSDVNRCFSALKTNRLGENTVETNTLGQKAWHKNYANSESHYNAMVSTEYRYFGVSHAFVDSVRIGRSPNRAVEFDVFTDELSTVVNP